MYGLYINISNKQQIMPKYQSSISVNCKQTVQRKKYQMAIVMDYLLLLLLMGGYALSIYKYMAVYSMQDV